MGFVILPADMTTEIVRSAKYMLDRDLPIIEQLLLAELIEDGHFERHVREMRKKFTARRQTAVHSLMISLSGMLNISRNTAGLHLRASFDPTISRELIIACGRESGLSISGTQAYYLFDAPANEFLIQFAHVEESELKEQIELFASRLKANLSLQIVSAPESLVPHAAQSCSAI